MYRRPWRSILILCTVLAVGVPSAASANPAPSGRPPGPGWHRFHTPPFTEPAGTVCDFTVYGDIVRDDEWIRTLSTRPDGTPENVEITGPLTVRFRNGTTGRSLVGDLGGTGWAHFDPDGGSDWLIVGPFGPDFRAGNPYHSRGQFIMDGTTFMVLHPDDNAEIVVHNGKVRDVCAALS